MTTIRRQSIVSSGIIYFGFALGLLNTYLFTREGGFSPTQYGLANVTFMAWANIMYSFANLGMQGYIYKFYPFYKDNLPPSKNDQMAWALGVSTMGFLLVLAGGLIFRDLVIRKYGAHSEELVIYYYWIFPFGFGLTIYSLLEAYAWQLKESVLTNFLREVQFRVFTTLLIVLFLTGFIRNFDLFIKLYALTYLLLAAILGGWLIINKKLHLSFSRSRVTKKFLKKIVQMAALVWGGGLVFNIASLFPVFLIAAVVPGGLASVAVFGLAQNVASIIQAPQRGIISASIGPLSRAWKDKDYVKINRVYHRSSINQLVFSAGMFILIWINFTDGVFTFHLLKGYLDARYVFLFLGLIRVVDMGTGLNTQIIGTSIFWRFDFISGLILIALMLPMSYILAKQIGVKGPAIADLITMCIYNGIRYLFLLKKFKMQPFTLKSLYTIALAFLGFALCHILFRSNHGLFWMFLRTAVFMSIYLSGIIYFNISEDVIPVWATIKKRLRIRR
jgi:O-antigen/teichoic acid export membrane protein